MHPAAIFLHIPNPYLSALQPAYPFGQIPVEEEYQGGAALGKACIKAVTDSYVGLEEETMLTDMLLKKFGCKDVDELLFQKVTGKISLEDYLSLPIDPAAHKFLPII